VSGCQTSLRSASDDHVIPSSRPAKDNSVDQHRYLSKITNVCGRALLIVTNAVTLLKRCTISSLLFKDACIRTVETEAVLVFMQRRRK
jgi:hypothetical protein